MRKTAWFGAARLGTAIPVAALFQAAWPLAHAATLPVPCTSSACVSSLNSKFGTSAAGFVSAGQATWSSTGSKLTVDQTSANATLNWQSFNISANGTVQFVQPSATAVALNQINDANASQIFGALNANGRVFLINQNGIIFGAGAQVNVGGLVASTLNINPTAVTSGLIAPGSNGNPAFQAFPSGSSGAVTVDNGATLQTSSGGEILMFALTISNQGSISTPGGQTLLAAGNTIYLATPPSGDQSLRGMLVEVGGTGGTVTNGTSGNATVTTPAQLVGQILAKDGNVTLAGLAVNQLGRVSATTSINENGSIRLQAGDNGSINASAATGVSGTPQDGTGGRLVLGPHSATEVTLDSTDPSTTVDSVPQLKSDIDMTGDNIQILADSVARATSGTIEVTAQQSPLETSTQSDGSRVYLAPGAELDVSGASIVLPVSINVIPVELRGYELADSPLQQNGPLRSQTVYVDIRTGTPLANISGEIAAIGHNVIERNLAGGTITIQSHGDVILAPGSLIDVAGGWIQYTPGYLDTTELLTTTGQIVNIGAANPNMLYTGIVNTATVSDPKWGTSSTYTSTPETYAPGYMEGKDAGTLSLSAPQFVFDSSVNTSTVTGIYQRQPDQALPSGDLYRAYNQVPLAATLIIGSGSPGSPVSSNFVVDNVTIASGLVLPGLVNSDGSPFNPLTDDPSTDPLPASYTASLLRPQLLGTQGFGNVSIYTNGKFLQPANVALSLPAGGSFSVMANSIDIEGSIDVPGGTITAVAEPTAVVQPAADFALTLGPQAALTANGEWVNDNPLLYPNGNLAPLIINGGAISLTALSNSNDYSPGIRLAPGSLIDVSGGGQLTNLGELNAGVGGSISVGAETAAGTLAGAPPRLELGATLLGYGIYDGGSLSLTDSAVCIAATDCSTGDSVLWMSPAALASGGFSAYSLTADQGGLNVAAGTTVTLRQQNLVLPRDYQMLPDQTTLIGRATLGVLADQLRQPVNLTLTQNYPDNEASVVNYLTTTNATPSLVVGAGALIQGDPLASISLSSNVRILMDGTLSAPGGTIALDLSAVQPATYDPTQGIWLGAQSVLDAAGTAQIYLNSTEQRTGTVFGGGTVNLTASRGYLELLPGSVIDVDGSSGIIDETGVGSGAVRAEQVASAGGAVNLTAAEGMELGGTFEAAAGIAGAGVEQPAGGSFSLTLDGSTRNDLAASFGGTSTFAGNARQIIVSATQPPVVISPGYAVPESTDGFAYVSAGALKAAGFDTVSLTAASLPTQGGVVLPGSIDFVGDVTLSAGELISLSAATYSVSAGSTAHVLAPYIEFGNSEQIYSDVPAATPGSGTLDVAGGFIELYGTAALQGVGTAQFDSTGDLRLLGLLDLANPSATTLNGALSIAGNLDLTAQQIYPTTLSQFVLSADPSSVTDPAAGSITIQGHAGSNQDLLSAGGSVTLSAGTVTQDGVLRAPFGNINIDAQTVTLGANSLTSTSADGLTIPFGTTQGGIDWVYPLQNGSNVVYGTDGIAPPAQRVTLQGAQVNVQSGAVIDVSGGGDLQAYEWIAGTGGTNDVLSNSTLQGGRPTQFAILPSLSANVAPYDPNISAGTTLQVGDAVYLSGMPGLPAGVYQLLPARYALLPGAYLVTQVSGYQDIQAGQAIPVLGGGTIIAGYDTVAGTSFGDSRTSGFDVVPASVVLQQAQYTTTSANQFFASQAASAGVAPPRLPQDSGVLALIASQGLTLNGTLRTDAASDGLGAEVDISSADILVAPGAAAAQSGQIVLTTASLDALGAQTLLLGGLNTDDVIDTTAQSVQIGAGANLTAPQLLIAAQNQITVGSGASITATGTAPAAAQSYTLSGDGAFLSVSAGLQNSVTRSDTTGAAGVLTLAPGSSIVAKGGAVYLDASNNVVTQGTLSVAGGDLAVQSPDIILGAAPAGVTGTVLGSNILGAQGLRNLLLDSGSAIDLYGSVDAGAQNISVNAPGLLGFGATGDAVALSATNTFTLGNSQGGTAGGAGTGTGALTITAPNITLSGGTVAASGFGTLALNAGTTLTAAADGGLTTAGNLNVTTSRITTAADVDLTLSATGAVSLLAPSKPATLAAASNLGGTLSVTGSSIDVATQIALPSGLVTLTTTGTGAAGNLSLQSGGSIDVAGLVQQYDGVNVASPGGAVSLASAGNIALAAGSAINVSAGSGGQGGSLTISAPNGTVSVGGALSGTGAAGMGASFSIDAQQFGDFATLNQILNAGGFSGGRTVRLRGPGDLVVGTGSANAITANNVSLEADQGGITVNGLINASGVQGGSVTLAALDDVIVNGTIDAQATGAGQNGGAVQLETTQGQMLLNSGSSIDVSGGAAAAGGSVLLRVPSATVAAVLGGGSGVALNGSIVGSSSTTLEAFSVYQNTTGVISTTDSAADMSNPIYAAASNFMNNASAITAALGQASNGAFVLEPGVEIDATTQSNGTGTLALDSAWNLYDWRFGPNDNVPGVLTLRAQNGITFNASLSDGFAATSGTGAFTLPTRASDSWSYRIVAGADFTAANPLTVDTTNPASVTIAPCGGGATCNSGSSSSYAPNMVRTGNGFIDVSAAGDFVLGDQESLLYTAGVASDVPDFSTGRGSLQGLAYPTDGGDIQINVAGDVIGAVTDQFVNAWLWRVGSTANSPRSATAWTVDFQNFQQGVAALAGGNVSVTAGGDISNLSVSIPSIGVQLGGATYADNLVQVQGGGNLTVTAGGSIWGGSYYVGQGSAALQAGADVGAMATGAGGTGLAPIIGLGNASVAVTARGNLELADILNPSLLNLGSAQGSSAAAVYFSTYGPTSAVSLTAVGGNVVLNDQNDNGAVPNSIDGSFVADSVVGNTNSVAVLDMLPPILNIAALSGDVDIGRVIALSPSPSGNLTLFANQNFVDTSSAGGVAGQLIVSDADPTQLPTPAAPQDFTDAQQLYGDIVNAFGSSPTPDQHAPTPVYESADQSGTLQPVRVVALNGSVEFQTNPGGAAGGIWSAKPVQVVAGLDVVNLNLVAQNLGAADVTSVTAGRDIIYPEAYGATGTLLPDTNGIVVDGPGELQLAAGGNVDLGTSAGVSTRANLLNPVLPATGASISVEAGIGGGAPQYASFISQYVTGSSEFDSDLIAFVQGIDGVNGFTAAQAKQQFAAMTPALQRTFVEELFFDLLQIYGSKEAASGNGDFSGAFAAISALFPGANPNLAQGQTNPYAGDIDLYFSRIYTEQGGNISLLAPGGEINVGLALSPSGFGLSKLPDQLGIVAQTTGNVSAFSYDDLQVNQSRLFAADGGDIIIWSTEGNIDAGAGAKTSISAPEVNIAYDSNGQPAVSLRAAIAGSGIQALTATPGVSAGNVYLFAPHGVVNADDAGIVAGNLTVAATAVLGASNITVSGTSVGVPVTVTGVGASFAAASSTAGATANVAGNFNGANSAGGSTPVADAAISWLDVFVTGLGEENCKPDDMECLKRQSTSPRTP
jgi:filamentous hemagglutinin family protein